MSESVVLKVTSAFLVGGQVAKAGELVEVTKAEAKDLLHRGKATLAVSQECGGAAHPFRAGENGGLRCRQ